MTSGRTPLAALTNRATFFDAIGNSVPDVNCSGPSGGTRPTRGTARDSKPSMATGYPPDVGVPRHRVLGVAHVQPALERLVILVAHRPHHLADVERLLAARVPLVREDVADQFEAGALHLAVREQADVARDRVARHGAPREPLARHHVGVVVVAQQDPARLADVARPVLRLAVRAP